MSFNRGKSFVLIMVVIAITALVLRYGVQQIIEISFTQNESTAQAILKLVSTSLENFAKDHLGNYPAGFSLLTQTSPAYLDKDYIKLSPVKGYNYSCARMDTQGYSCSAVPVKCNLTGRKVFSVSTGNLFISEDCAKKED